MKESFDNKVNIRGYVFSHKLKENVSKKDGRAYINGTINIATDENAINVIGVNFFVFERKKDNGINQTFTTLKQIISSDSTVENCGVGNATRVRISASVDINDFYNKSGQLVSGKRVNGSFIHILKADETIGNTPAYFELDALFQNAADKEYNGRQYLQLKGFTFNYRKDIVPITLNISSEQGMNYFLGEDISAQNPYFGRVWGQIISTVETVEKQVDNANVAFGDPAVQASTRTSRSWEIEGANLNEGLSEATITQEELNEAMKVRQTKLAELQQANSNSAFVSTPVAATAVQQQPANAVKDYGF